MILLTVTAVNSEIILLSHHYPDTPAEQLTLGVGVVMSSTAQTHDWQVVGSIQGRRMFFCRFTFP